MATFATSEPLTAASLTTQELYRELLARIGEDPTRDGLLDTPERMEKSMAFLTRGYAMDVKTVLHEALFDDSFLDGTGRPMPMLPYGDVISELV